MKELPFGIVAGYLIKDLQIKCTRKSCGLLKRVGFMANLNTKSIGENKEIKRAKQTFENKSEGNIKIESEIPKCTCNKEIPKGEIKAMRTNKGLMAFELFAKMLNMCFLCALTK